MPLNQQMTLKLFKKWEIDFVGPIKPKGKASTRYIITATEYLTHWVEVQLDKDYTATMAMKFLFEHMLTPIWMSKNLNE